MAEITCDGCGVCCANSGAPPFATRGEIEALPDPLRAELTAYADSLRVPGSQSREMLGLACLWLRDGRCANYAHRPPLCVTYEVGGSECRAARAAGGQ